MTTKTINDCIEKDVGIYTIVYNIFYKTALHEWNSNFKTSAATHRKFKSVIVTSFQL